MKYIYLALAFLLIPSLTGAAIVEPTSYDMLNGETGSRRYWDKNYTGSGSTTTDRAALTGGLGDLTDGIVASDNWNIVENYSGTGPYVGWWHIDPIITFHFSDRCDFETVRIHFDDSNGYGRVFSPESVTINNMSFSVADPAGSAPFWAEFDITGVSTDTLEITLNRKNGGWVFTSEFDFTASSPVPVPGAVWLFASGLIGLAGVGRKNIK